jgi:nucleotide-binding universal stress UspA family protein
MRVILVPVADRPECTRALQAAFDLGQRVGASVSGCHIRPHRYSEVALSPGFPDEIWRRKSTKEAPAAARALFREIARINGFTFARRPRTTPRALWSERVGTPERIMGIVGPVSDLLIVSRPAKPHTVADMFMCAALFESSRPVLLLPPKNRRKIGRRVCIGWNQSVGAANAVVAAMPVLVHAREVTIVTCGPEDRHGPKAGQLVNYLRHWGVDAAHVRTPGRRVEAELLAACKDLRADLLVSGAYSRSRWRERIFGGTTEFLIRKARMPVLMLHG